LSFRIGKHDTFCVSEERRAIVKKNVGGIDSIIRTALEVVAALVGFFVSMSMGPRLVAFLIAVVLLFTGIYGFCPIWSALGISTYKEKKA
jgi:hypothetical protein